MHICLESDIGDKMDIRPNTDKSAIWLKKGQRVKVVRTVAIAIEVDIREYLDEWDEDGIWCNELELDIENNLDIETILDQWDEKEITDISVEVTEIL